MPLRKMIAKLQEKWSGRSAAKRAAKPKWPRMLELELLEKRDLMSATVPTIIKVTPSDQGSLVQSTTNPNTIIVQYSEAMFAADQTISNYTLFGPNNTPITISSVTADATIPDAYDITFANGQVGGAYTLLVKGDMVHESTDKVALAQPGQLVVANSGSGTSSVSTINQVDSSPILNAVQTYPMGTSSGTFGGTTTPTAVVVADFNGDGVADLAVANSQVFGSEVDIYAGKAGGGFDATPDASLALPAAASTTSALIAFNPTGAVKKTGFADLAVLDPGNGTIDVFSNNQTTGAITTTSFADVVSYATGATTPVGLAAGNFNNDFEGNTDLATVDSFATGNNFNVDFLPGNGDGTFGTAVAVIAGTTAPTGIQNPTSIAAGGLKSANSADLAVGGSNGVETLINNGIGGAFSFTLGAVISNSSTGAPATLLSSVTSVAIGNINGDGGNDIVASSASSNNVEVLANMDDGTGTINAALSQTFSLGATEFGNVVGLSTNASGLADIITVNTNANQVTVLQNTSTAATFSFTAAAHYTVDARPIALAIGAVEGDANPDVITANTGTGSNQGGTFSILRNNSASVGTYLVSTPLPELATAQPDSIAVGDLNGDGIADLVVANLNTNSVSVYLATSAGVYGAPKSYTITDSGGKGNGPVSVTLARLTGAAGPLDIITADRDGFVSVLANNGSGVFAAPVTFAVGSNPTQVVAGNFDGSGNISLAVSHNGGGSAVNARGVTLLLGNGNRTFQAGQEILPNVEATALVAGNFTTTTPGAPLDLVVADDGTGSVALLQNNGKGVFTQLGAEIAVGPNPSALAAADFNRDGLLDVVAVSKDTTDGTEQIAVLLNSASDGFAPASFTSLPFNFAVNSVAVTDVNGDGSPDLVVGLSGAGERGGATSENAPADPNFYVLTGNGDGTFSNPVPYMAGGAANNTVVATVSDPLVHVTTFNLISNIVIADLVQNGGFEGKDLSGAQGNLIGWQTANVGQNSRGGWYTQTKTHSPLSVTTVPLPTPYVQPPAPAAQLPDPEANTGQSLYRAMLDQSNLIPIGGGGFGGGGFNPNSVESYAGSNFLYQDVTLPSDPTATSLIFSISLYIQSKSGFTSGESSLDYDNPDNTNPDVGNDQQVRVDIMLPNQPIDSTNVIENIFQTTSSDKDTMNFTLTADLSSILSAFRGQTIRIRIAAVNNMGQLIVGVDNVSLQSKFTDVTAPTFPGQPTLRNPGFVVNAQGLTSTTDPTLIGQVADNGGVNNIAYVAFSPTNDGTYNKPGDFRISALSLDATGKFSVTLPNPVLGLNTVGVEVVDKAGNVTIGTPISFIYQGPSITDWQAIGPGSINTGTGLSGVQYTSVSGRINTILVDPQDSSGDTYLIGSDNGGIWKTTDGGADWTPATDYLADNGTPINVPIGALAGAVDSLSRNGNPPTNQFVVYAGTGDATPAPDSRAGSGILVSHNGGNSFVVAGNSDVVLAGARISKMAVDPNDTNVAYAAVASGGEFGPGVYKTTDGGLTWTNILTVASMNLTALGFPTGTTLASVTDLSLNAHDSNLLTIGMGNIGLVGASATAGVWTSQNKGISWQPVVGGENPNILNSTLPGARPIINPNTKVADPNSGIFLGRVTLAEAFGTNTDISTLYVLIASPPAAVPISGNNVNFGNALDGTPDTTPSEASSYHNTPTLFGLYKNGGAINGNNAFTHVMVREQAGSPSPDIPTWHDVDLTGVDGSNSGAIIVDPTDPNVVYVGGSEEYPVGAQGPNVGLLRIDTGNMLDTSTLDPITDTYLNNGDDITKRVAAYDTTNNEDKFEYPTVDDQGYIGEGVSWLDVSTNAFESQFSSQFGGESVPPNITSIAIDSQNRIVLGTEQGIYRLVYQGTGYDFTSGGEGIIAQGGANGFPTPVTGSMPTPRPTPPTSTIQLTSINGNLAIADLTSVAIDPSIPGRYYTTQYNTGASSITNGVNSAITQGLTGFIGVPDGDQVLVGKPDPNAPAGTLNTVYQLFAFGDRSELVAFQPTSSVQGGVTGSFIDIPTTNIGYTDNAGYMPVFTEGSIKVFDNGSKQFFDELLLGTDRIYTTRTSAGDFTQVPNSPGTASGGLSKFAGGVISAAAIAPTNDQIIYAGTNKGEIFVTLNNGGDFFPERITGLPTLATSPNLTVNSITVDPLNAMLAYATFSGVKVGTTTVSEIFKTVNGGMNWTNITGNLPNVGANALVDDPQSEPGVGAPNGHLYVATNVGVYVSVNGGTTWTILGVGLPHAPVVSLQFSSTLQELVAGTQGRGVFQISTDVTGPHAISEFADSAAPNTPINPVVTPLTSVTVTFNKAIGSFPASQVTIIGPNGQVIKEIGSPTNVSTAAPGFPNPQTTWQITFAPQTADGDYTFKIGPNVSDLVGNPMDQNQNGVNGEVPGDIYTFQVALNSTQDGQFVTGQYNDELGRPADTNGFISILTPVDNALYSLLPSYAFSYVQDVGRPQLVQDIYGQTGTGDKSIIGVGDLIGRAATTNEVNFWLGQLQNGLSYEQMLVQLADSPTYFAESRVNGNDTNFVTAIYNDLLNRAPNTLLELNPFVSQLNGAELTSRTQDARALLAGQPYQTDFIQSVYNQFLNRNAANSEVNFQLNQFALGSTEEQIIANILGTQEYYTIDAPNLVGQPASNATLITAMYDQLFPGYTVSQGEINHWVALINNPTYVGGANPKGLSAEQIANMLDTTSLYRFGTTGPLPTTGSAPAYAQNGLVDREYMKYLGRFATLGELNYWASVYAANPNYRTEDLIATILGSAEYFADNTTANTPLPSQDQQFADALYTSVLGSTNETAEQTRDLPFLANAELNARSAVGEAIVGSQEYRDDVTTYVFQTDLGRAPTAVELGFWRSTIGKNGVAGGPNGDEQLLDAVFSSPEYYTHVAPDANHLHTNDTWLTSLYANLHVPFNAAQETTNLGTLDAGYAGARLAAIQTFQTSPEYVAHITINAYNLYLGRAPSAGEIAFWLGKFQAGGTQQQQIAGILASQEYYNRTPLILGLTVQPSNKTFVDAAYLQLFPGYTVTQADENTFVVPLNNGKMTTLQVATTLVDSSLYQFGSGPASNVTIPFNGFVERAYTQYLGRAITQNEINFWASMYNPNNPGNFTINFLSTLFDSQEYLEKTHQFP